MSNLQNSHQEQGIWIPEFKSTLTASLATAFERTGTEPTNVENIIKDLHSEFGHIEQEHILKAIRNGSLGKYGKTFKLTTQEVCIWIRNYILEVQHKHKLKAPWD